MFPLQPPRGARVRARLLEPPREVVKRLAPRDVVHEQRAGGAAVVTPRDGPEAFLAGRVPNLNRKGVSILSKLGGNVVNSYRFDVLHVHFACMEHREERRFPDSPVAEDDQVKFLVNNQAETSPAFSGFQSTYIEDKYQIIIGNIGFSRVGLIESIEVSKQGSTPITWTANLSFIAGAPIAAE